MLCITSSPSLMCFNLSTAIPLNSWHPIQFSYAAEQFLLWAKFMKFHLDPNVSTCLLKKMSAWHKYLNIFLSWRIFTFCDFLSHACCIDILTRSSLFETHSFIFSASYKGKFKHRKRNTRMMENNALEWKEFVRSLAHLSHSFIQSIVHAFVHRNNHYKVVKVIYIFLK